MAVHDFRSQRLYIQTPLVADAVHACSKEQSNYLRNVLRLGEADEILVFNGCDGEWRARVQPDGKRACNLVAVEQVRPQLQGPDLEYLFAPLKRGRLDYMVQKATEMGVSALHPVITSRTIVGRVNTDRMRSNVVEAAEQCGVLRIPQVHEPSKLTELLSGFPQDRALIFADEGADISSPLAALAEIGRGRPVSVLVGPEGGFSEDERRLIHALPGTCTVSLGPRIMRADTAAVALLALVNASIGDWGG